MDNGLILSFKMLFVLPINFHVLLSISSSLMIFSCFYIYISTTLNGGEDRVTHTPDCPSIYSYYKVRVFSKVGITRIGTCK